MQFLWETAPWRSILASLARQQRCCVSYSLPQSIRPVGPVLGREYVCFDSLAVMLLCLLISAFFVSNIACCIVALCCCHVSVCCSGCVSAAVHLERQNRVCSYLDQQELLLRLPAAFVLLEVRRLGDSCCTSDRLGRFQRKADEYFEWGQAERGKGAAADANDVHWTEALNLQCA
jgi:hypothetical protein